MKANNILKLLPCLAAFLTIPAIPANAGDDEKVTLNKTATYNYETQTGEITLETYLQGGVRTTATSSSSKPLDIVLVLDYSGSMSTSYSDAVSPNFNSVNIAKVSYSTWNKNQTSYSAKLNGVSYTINCFKSTDGGRWAYITAGGKRYYVTLDGSLYESDNTNPSLSNIPTSMYGNRIMPTTSDSQPLFGTQSSSTVNVSSRVTGLRAAASAFVDSLEFNARQTGADHRITVISFQNQKWPSFTGQQSGIKNYVDNTHVDYLRQCYAFERSDADGIDSRQVTCTTILYPWRSITDPNTTSGIKAAMGLVPITAAGSTAIEYGMYLAKLQLERITRNDSKKVVIVLTDGAPRHGEIIADYVVNGYFPAGTYTDTEVGTMAIGVAQKIKATAEIYTIAFGESDNDFMKALSSNYPNATSKTSLGTPSAIQTYAHIVGSTTLTQTFDNILKSSFENAKFTTETIIQDAMNMKYFKLPKGMTTADVKLYTDACTDYDPSTKVYSFANSLQPLTLPANSITVDGDSIVKIKGFDFQANWCGLVNTTPHGNRLVAKFPFELKGGDNMPTNVLTNDGAKSGLIPKPETGAYPSAPTDAALKFPTPSLKFATIEIVRNGLDAGESAIYIVTCGTDTVACVSVNGVGANQPVSKFIYGLEAGAGKMYKVTETNWNWAYEKDPTDGYILKEVNPSDNSAVKFEFGGAHIKKSSTDPTEKLHPAEIHNHDEQYIPNIINVESL